MIAWMIYLVTVTLLLALSARFLERALRSLGHPVRGLWLGAAVGSVLLPMALHLAPTSGPSPEGGRNFERWQARWQPEPEVSGDARQPASAPESRAPDDVARRAAARTVATTVVDRIPRLWAATSLLLAALLGWSYRGLARRRRHWSRLSIGGREVWVSPDTGPAAVGFIRGEIVIPEWLLHSTEAEREMVLAHEQEHIRAGDSRLLLGALLLWIAMPWNLALLWILRCLRRAVELDCDLRVVARGTDPRAYARMLVRVMTRGQGHPFAVAMLPESSSFLERRIRLLLESPGGDGRRRSLPALLVASGCLVAACATDQPALPTEAPAALAEEVESAAWKTADSATVAGDAEAPETSGEPAAQPEPPQAEPRPDSPPPAAADDPEADVFRRLIEDRHPELLSETVRGGRAAIYFIVDARGTLVASSLEDAPTHRSCAFTSTEIPPPADRSLVVVSGCSWRPFGPNSVFIAYLVLKPRPGEELQPPSGPYGSFYAFYLENEERRETVIRPAVARHHRIAFESGLPYGEELWFIVDSRNNVLHTGQWWRHGSSLAARAELERRFPHLRIEQPAMMSVAAANDQRISVAWAVLSTSGESRPRPSLAENRIGLYTVTSAAPGEQVRVSLEGPATRDPSAFRFDGRFTRLGEGVFSVVTPFTLVIVTQDAFEARIDSASQELSVAWEQDRERREVTGRSAILRRASSGREIHSLVADRIAAGP